MGTTHASAGFVLWVFLQSYFVIVPYSVVLFVLGSLLPDLDHPEGTLRQLIDLPRFLSRAIDALIPHRGPLHTVWASIFFSFVTAFVFRLLFGIPDVVAQLIGLSLGLGYCSHLALDSLTPHGVEWLRPLSHRALRGPISTGSHFERGFFLFLVVSPILWWYVHTPSGHEVISGLQKRLMG